MWYAVHNAHATLDNTTQGKATHCLVSSADVCSLHLNILYFILHAYLNFIECTFTFTFSRSPSSSFGLVVVLAFEDDARLSFSVFPFVLTLDSWSGSLKCIMVRVRLRARRIASQRQGSKEEELLGKKVWVKLLAVIMHIEFYALCLPFPYSIPSSLFLLLYTLEFLVSSLEYLFWCMLYIVHYRLQVELKGKQILVGF